MFSGNTSQVSSDRLYVEDVFSTWLYTGTGAAQTITNGIDLAGKGGLVWIKSRSAATNNFLFDTTRGINIAIKSNAQDANQTIANSLTAFNSNGFSIGGATGIGTNAATYASWTFREAPKFFDVVTWTGTGTTGFIPHDHSLGSTPGVIMVKRTDSLQTWYVYHRSLGVTQVLRLDTTGPAFLVTSPDGWAVSDTTFSINTVQLGLNDVGATYVAYLFAHDATSDGIIQCGSFTTNASGAAMVTLGWEPQWVMVKRTDSTGNWIIYDTMRGMPVGGYGTELYPNLSNAESLGFLPSPTATGFIANLPASATFIYIAIRRGPMKTPTLGTSVFSVDPQNITISSAPRYRSGFVTDMFFWKEKNTVTDWTISSRLTGTGIMSTNTTAAETSSAFYKWDYMNGALNIASNDPNKPAWMFRRAPGFFDEVCYTGTGAAGTITHNLGVVPELVITKGRGSVTNWGVYTAALGPTKALLLNTTSAEITSANYWNNTAPTATQVSLGVTTNSSTTFVAYLFASAPGVSKVGSYTGNGSSQTINCGFAAGARFVMIKRTDSTGDWYVWDTARGIVSGNDPHLSLNTTAAEVTTDDTIDTDSSGFVVNQVAATNVNVSSATYIYLAIA